MKKFGYVVLMMIGLTLGNCSKSSTSDSDNNTSANSKIDKSGNLLETGLSASDLLGNTNFSHLKIEMGYVDGYRPTATAVSALTDFLTERTFKETISVSYQSLTSTAKETLTLQEIDELQNEDRTQYNTNDTIAVYIYFADAPSDDDDPEEDLVTLGAVYRNTSMVIYEETIRDLASKSATISTSDIETATLIHEFGHLFGLVNLNTTSVHDHESESENEEGELVGNNHCNVEGCLMSAELQFGRSAKRFLEKRASKGLATIPEFDEECLLDLQSFGGR